MQYTIPTSTRLSSQFEHAMNHGHPHQSSAQKPRINRPTSTLTPTSHPPPPQPETVKSLLAHKANPSQVVSTGAQPIHTNINGESECVVHILIIITALLRRLVIARDGVALPNGHDTGPLPLQSRFE